MMTRTADNSLNGCRYLQPFALALLLGALSFAALANPQAGSEPTGVRNSPGSLRLNERQLQIVVESLRQKTGFVELEFDRQGALMLGNRQNIAGGSATARALLQAAVDSANLYELESQESSPELAFARIVESVDRFIIGTSQRTTIHQVRLDFADFGYLHGAREAKTSFDIGLVLLHELTHGVLKLHDPRGGTDEIGECDAHVNQMRRESQLPERLYYHPGITVTQTSDGRRLVHARLVFVERAAANAQPSAKYSLSWLASQVAPNAQGIVGLQQGLLAARRR
ncbi:MAG: hypothetical protein ACREEM_23195 [Blastocatellia bacterium]